jgi:uncharacterized protein YegL
MFGCSNGFQATGGPGKPDQNSGPAEAQPVFSPRADEAAQANGNLAGNDGCSKAGVETVNVVIVLDASGSQKDTDPTMVRRSASLEFAAKLDSVARQNISLSMSIATISFARQVEYTSNRWVRMGDALSLAKVTADIHQATGSTRSGTHYAPALAAAAQLLAEIGTDQMKKSHRNFVVFMTDGKPNGADSATARQNEISGLLSRFDAAIIGVASGTGISEERVPEVESLAKPVTNSSKPKHVGQYIRARSGDDVTRAFSQAFDRIANCQ